MIDLRSDTVTVPSPAMRQAIAEAAVGDDVFGEDPTVIELQTETAKLLGQEAGLLVPSGTMGNQVAIKTHTQPGDEVICEYGAHLMNYEAGGPAFHSQVQLHPIHGSRGAFTAADVVRVIRPANVHMPPSRLICIENTHNRAGGTIFPIDEIQAIRKVAEENQLLMHLDGARLLNAAVATGIPPAIWAGAFDSVSICLSKGLGAPVGSVLCGTKEFITCAHRYRKIFGGGMRQAGIIAAAGLFALRNNIDSLALDHKHARQIAATLAEIPGFNINPAEVETNIIIFSIDPEYASGASVERTLRDGGVACLAVAQDRIRMVTHRDLSAENIVQACDIIRKVLN